MTQLPVQDTCNLGAKELPLNTILCGDNLDVMPGFPDESFDLVVTDPPYFWNFMGRDWDKGLPSAEIWKECLRVLKPGAFAFVMCGPRQDCLARQILALEEAGFKIAYTSLFHVFAQGFPKASSISKNVDKRLGAEREIIGKYQIPSDSTSGRAGKEYTSKGGIGLPGQGAVYEYSGAPITAPATPQAKALEGSYAGFQPKPAVEVILVAMKPLSEKTYVDQAMANRKGVTWLDEGRIPYDIGGIEHHKTPRKSNKGRPFEYDASTSAFYSTNSRYERYNNQGRFPANLLVSDNVLDDGKVSNNYRPNSIGKSYPLSEGAFWAKNGDRYIFNPPNDSGSFSRYFDLDRWWAEKVKLLPKSVQKTFPFLIVPKASKSEKNRGCEGMEKRKIHPYPDNTGNPQKHGKHLPASNYHPTCKPIKLMSYLVTLGSRPGDVVLDPFAGSGTTCVAAKMDGRDYIGIDNDPEYCRIAKARIGAVQRAML